MLLNVPLTELTGQPPTWGKPWPPYRLLPPEHAPSGACLEKGLELMVWHPRRRLHPVDPDPEGPGVTWSWPNTGDPVTHVVRQWWMDAEHRRRLEAGLGECCWRHFAPLLGSDLLLGSDPPPREDELWRRSPFREAEPRPHEAA